ncbi:hypothetical protein TCAL_16249 [Tigriopus californicus]|uniref:Uncharacterized protein n=1 Tax=Tigriopus californicus TaxID=6832 RepID=A0A553N9Q1_TIGCA|nr:hypothetical protein TCAL_16249 [Tigriopus californicus]
MGGYLKAAELVIARQIPSVSPLQEMWALQLYVDLIPANT